MLCSNSLLLLLVTSTAVGPFSPQDPPVAASELSVLITEIMYNPASNEARGATEWVEIANVGSTPVTMAGWRLADEDDSPMQQFGPFDATLGPGNAAVLVNRAAVSEAQFRAAWDVADGEPASYTVIPIDWGSLANAPTDTNEILRLLDGRGEVICEVNFQHAPPWPIVENPGGPSIWLAELSPGSSPDVAGDGSRWRVSKAGESGARRCTPTAIFNGADIGSPGTVPGLTALPAPIAQDPPAIAPNRPPINASAAPRYIYDQGRRFLPPRADDVVDF